MTSCRSKHWLFFATVTSTNPLSQAFWQQRLEQWLEPYPDAYAFICITPEPGSEKLHAHLLIGGVPPNGESTLRRSFIANGHVKIDPFDPRRGGIEYVVLKQKAPFFAAIGSGTPKDKPRRKRRGRSRRN
jgi:hypothetical protein